MRKSINTLPYVRDEVTLETFTIHELGPWWYVGNEAKVGNSSSFAALALCGRFYSAEQFWFIRLCEGLELCVSQPQIRNTKTMLRNLRSPEDIEA